MNVVTQSWIVVTLTIGFEKITNSRHLEPIEFAEMSRQLRQRSCGKDAMHRFANEENLRFVSVAFGLRCGRWPQAGHNRPRSFLHFWRHHFWPKLALSLINFCRRKRSFQWCPSQRDRPYGAWDVHKNAQKVERKTRSKISCHHTWLLHGQTCPSQWRFLGSFLNCKQAQQKANHCSKNKRKGEKGKATENHKEFESH